MEQAKALAGDPGRKEEALEQITLEGAALDKGVEFDVGTVAQKGQEVRIGTKADDIGALAVDVEKRQEQLRGVASGAAAVVGAEALKPILIFASRGTGVGRGIGSA
jgi:hypothetical protein